TYAMDLARGLNARGTEVILATMGGPMSASQREEVAAMRGLRVIESSFKLEWMEEPWADVDAAGQWLLELEHRFAPDIVHLNGYAHGALPWRTPVLVVGHSCVLSWWHAVKGEPAPSNWQVYAQRVSQGLKHASIVAAPTQAMLNIMEEHYGPLPGARVLYNGRSEELFRTTRTKKPYIFAAGRLGDEAKNIQTLGTAAEELPWPVFVAGPESDASGSGLLPTNLTHCGKLCPTALAEWMGGASIYCLPARYEPFGLSILEAALSGCALVLGDIPTLRELWNGCACFVPPDDPAALRHTLAGLIADPARRESLAAAAQLRGRKFSITRFTEGYLDTYRRMLATPQRSQSLAA
ncbi:MAG: glycosyltransferase, partial [Verrucomicrobiaceae bacterium]